MTSVYNEVKDKLFEICKSRDFVTGPVLVRAKVLTAEEAIGNPETDDFPLQKGEERLMQAELCGSIGQVL
jgi:hypothetical protein